MPVQTRRSRLTESTKRPAASAPRRKAAKRSRQSAKPAAAAAQPATPEPKAGSGATKHAPEGADHATRPELQVVDVTINRAPVLALWAACVAEAEGYDLDSALTFGKAITGLFAQSKGRAVGIYEPREKDEAELRARERQEQQQGVHRYPVFGTHLKGVAQPDGQVRAYVSGKPIDPGAARRYVDKAFGDALPDVMATMRYLAHSVPRVDLGKQAYSLYTEFRPEVPAGGAGWGRRGQLSLARLLEMGDARLSGQR